MIDDAELLRRYARDGAEDAMAELVRRHIDLVYAVALRQTRGNAVLAEDATQQVFIDFARKAATLARHTVLVGWLHTATRYAVAKVLRSEQRRHAHEHEAQAMTTMLRDDEFTAAIDWQRVQPVLDDVLGELKERERVAILLRFYEDRPFAEIGARLALTETAARSCVDRALEKVRGHLARRGVTSTAAALATALASHAHVTAPAGLVASVTGAALAGAGVGSVAATATFMSITKIGIASAVVIGGAAGLWLQRQHIARLEIDAGAWREQEVQLTAVRTENGRLVSARMAAESRVAALEAEIAALKAQPRATDASAKSAASQKPNAASAQSQSAAPLAAGMKPVTNAGLASVTAAVETVHWAINGGDIDLLASCVTTTPEAAGKLQQLFASLPADKRAEFGTAQRMLATLLATTMQTAGLQVVSVQSGVRNSAYDAQLANDPAYSTLQISRQFSDGSVKEQELVFQQRADGWRLVMSAGAVNKMGGMLRAK